MCTKLKLKFSNNKKIYEFNVLLICNRLKMQMKTFHAKKRATKFYHFFYQNVIHMYFAQHIDGCDKLSKQQQYYVPMYVLIFV